MKNIIKKLRERRRLKKEEKEKIATPRITSENVAEHREDLLSGARKYIYPLQHSKHKIVIISTSLFLTVVLLFSFITVLFLYKFQTTSSFMYKVTKVVPFPIARTDGTFIAYENYLFELGHYMHYYENQQQLSFESTAGKAQLQSYKRRAIDKVINDAYVKIIAKEKAISVSNKEIDNQIRIARDQNRLGSNNQVFKDVLREFWNWSPSDFRRSLKSEILAQKVIKAMDPTAEIKAKEVLAKIKSGEDFSKAAAQYSDDLSTKNNGGEFGLVNKSNRNVSQQSVDVLFNLPEGQVSGITTVPYGTGYALSIIKNLEIKGDQRKGAHIIIRLKSLDEVLNDRKAKQPYRLYMNPVR